MREGVGAGGKGTGAAPLPWCADPATHTRRPPPAQQFNVVRARVAGSGGVGSEDAVLYYGERANSAPDRLFSHNFQAWVPLEFDARGAILPLTFPASFTLDLVNATTV